MSYIIGLVISIAAAYYLYTDSKASRIGNPIVWAIFGFLFSVFTLIVYFIMKFVVKK